MAPLPLLWPFLQIDNLLINRAIVEGEGDAFIVVEIRPVAVVVVVDHRSVNCVMKKGTLLIFALNYTLLLPVIQALMMILLRHSCLNAMSRTLVHIGILILEQRSI
jgi:hypothetical protein